MSKRERLETAGRWLRRAREQRGYDTAEAFARDLGVDPSMISRYERGASEISDERAEEIAKVLGMDIITVRRNLGLWVPPEVESDSTGSPAWDVYEQKIKELLSGLTGEDREIAEDVYEEYLATRSKQDTMMAKLLVLVTGKRVEGEPDRPSRRGRRRSAG